MATGDPRHVRAALRAMETELQGLVEPTEARLHEGEQLIRHAEEAHRQAMIWLDQERLRAKAALQECRANRDDKGRGRDCSHLHRRIDDLSRAAATLAARGQQLEQAARRYRQAAADAREAIGRDIPRATHWLRERERALAQFEGGRLGLGGGGGSGGGRAAAGHGLDAVSALGAAAVATGSPALLSAFTSFFDGMGGHGHKYQKARQSYLRSLADDPAQPRHVRGWVRQELNRIDAGKRARAAGLRPPGGSARNLRGIPGLDVGHRFPGLDLAANFRLEDASVNRARYHIAKRLGLSELYR